jgi:hypothetical protein
MARRESLYHSSGLVVAPTMWASSGGIGLVPSSAVPFTFARLKLSSAPDGAVGTPSRNPELLIRRAYPSNARGHEQFRHHFDRLSADRKYPICNRFGLFAKLRHSDGLEQISEPRRPQR